MPSPNPQLSWTSPEYVATVAGALATGALVFYSSFTEAGPTVDEVLFVGLGITVPVTIAYEIARRWA